MDWLWPLYEEHVRRENSRGEAQPQLRGMESRRVAVLVDGEMLQLARDLGVPVKESWLDEGRICSAFVRARHPG